MKYIRIVFFALLLPSLSSCVKDVVDEGVKPSFLPHFIYGGYTYYIHPSSMDKMCWAKAEEACNELESFGYDDWFMPSQSEIEQAHSAGFDWVVGWSSTSWGTYHGDESEWTAHWACYYSDDECRWGPYRDDMYLLVVFPMRKQ